MVALSSTKDRITEVDALRGFAVIGIVWMNVYVFALPFQAYSNPIVWGGEGALEVDAPPTGGCTVTVSIPWEACAEGAP